MNINLSPEVQKHIEANPYFRGYSEEFENWYRNSWMRYQELEKQIQQANQIIETNTQMIREVASEIKGSEALVPYHQLLWIHTEAERLRKHGLKEYEIWKCFKNKFSIKISINSRQFYMIAEQIRQKTKECEIIDIQPK